MKYTYLDTKGLAEMLHVSKKTVERWRYAGGGPEYSKMGRKVLYRLSDVELWLEANRYASTAEYNL